MNTELTADDITSRLNLEHIEAAAAWAAQRLAQSSCAVVHLTPGDATRYEVVVIASQNYYAAEGERHDLVKDYLVVLANDFGRAYPWSGQEVHATYAASKWAHDGRLWTGVVMAQFLNALWAQLPE